MKTRTKTDYLVIHCAATKPSMDIGVKEIREWHKAQGWQDCGYHFVIRRDGTREIGRHHDLQGSHVKGFNNCSVGVCLVGGIDDDGKPANNFTLAQFNALDEVLQILKMHYPKAEILGHCELNPGKACPSFDVQKWLQQKEND
jgi:N-acetyl-anhydromuramyl-L-alanine amidase AmpD